MYEVDKTFAQILGLKIVNGQDKFISDRSTIQQVFIEFAIDNDMVSGSQNDMSYSFVK